MSGAVERVENYGVFLQVEGTKGRAGRGLVPPSELGEVDEPGDTPTPTELSATVAQQTTAPQPTSIPTANRP